MNLSIFIYCTHKHIHACINTYIHKLALLLQLCVQLSRFSKQEELNSIFNSFVCTVRESYFGRNEMTSQLYHLDFKSHKSRPYCESKGSDEALPLGPDFQYFVALFIMYDISGKFWKPVGLRPDILSLVHSLKASHRFFGTLEAKDQYKQEQLDIRSLQTLRLASCSKKFGAVV